MNEFLTSLIVLSFTIQGFFTYEFLFGKEDFSYWDNFILNELVVLVISCLLGVMVSLIKLIWS